MFLALLFGIGVGLETIGGRGMGGRAQFKVKQIIHNYLWSSGGSIYILINSGAF